MRKGIRTRPGIVRAMTALLLVLAVVVVVKELPALRRYIKSESM
ncbi:DUF6893 family small protein [Actinomadura graeca]|nr:hypothetical protein [Actinomadura graeca]